MADGLVLERTFAEQADAEGEEEQEDDDLDACPEQVQCAVVDDEEDHRADGIGDGEADVAAVGRRVGRSRSEEHTSELQSLMRLSYAVFCLKKNKTLTLT